MLLKLFHKLKHFRSLWLSCLLAFCFTAAHAQYFDLDARKKKVTIPFKLVRNLMVIKLSINNRGPFNFILDTGVGLMIITDPKLADSISIPNKRTLKIPGLGEGADAEAYVTSALKIDIPGLVSYDVAAAILKKDLFSLSGYAGMPIHGLIGYEFFNNLAVKIDFQDSTVTVSRPKDLKVFRKGTQVPITIEDRKPYVESNVILQGGRAVKSKLIIDLGAGHPISLEKIIPIYGLPQKFIASANLGIGLNGPINGFIARLESLEIGKFKIKGIISSFPDDGNNQSRLSVPRDGNLGIGVLKRFSVIFDYTGNSMYLKPNMNFKEPFEHDMSGIEYYAAGANLDRIIINRVEPGSAGDEIGLERDDEIVAINFKPVSKMSLEEIDALFRSRNDRSLLLDVFHDKKLDKVVLTLKRRI
ncbi:aspartyl protease family protein [Mucilaginibacter ginsenosidivorax]|uniref:Peptide-binding protein n=1 Tax=Mucilaginibacter ginsenosidivorax TaxID=862126 RepID=A0A5B8W1Y3_9SPHI|nr:aspartyl protease family protein [Mucilaginibacter ginsenosidivorax]QEC77479.1 peptide-binding protein [Mucilaginibacter ginsenosidivorax]